VVLLITVTGGRKPDTGVLAAWPDGRLIWSAQGRLGGPPYRTARVARRRVTDAIRSIAAGGKLVGVRYLGPDMRHMRIRVGSPDDPVIDAASAHEVAERNPALVAIATGIEPLADRSREDVLAAQPGAYRAFRARWSDVLDAVLKLCPSVAEAASPADVEELSWDTMN
jgi:hypothetical protein